MEAIQLTFNFPKEETNYWRDIFGFIPKVGDLVRIDEVVAYCLTLKRNKYCYCMRVKVKEISNEMAICETTKEWEEASFGYDKSGMLWKIPVKNLAPIFN